MSRLLIQDELGKVKVTKEGMALPEIRDLRTKDHTSGKTTFAEILKYVYFVHDRDSPYADLGPNQKRNEVWKDQFEEYKEEEFRALADKSDIKNLINKITLLQYTPAERHLKACEDKFEQFEQLYVNTEVSHENYEKVAAQLRGSNSLYEVLDKLREKVFKEVKEKNEGGYTPSLFEDN